MIDQILTHLRARAARESHAGPRSPRATRVPARRGASRAQRPSRGAGELGDRAVSSTNSRLTPIEIPIPWCRKRVAAYLVNAQPYRAVVVNVANGYATAHEADELRARLCGVWKRDSR